MWRLRFKLTKSAPWVDTQISETNSASAWRAWYAYQIVNGITDYYAAEAFEDA